MVHVCCACGAQFEGCPSCCLICEDERQYVGNNGQQTWISQEELLKKHENVIKEEEPSVTGIGTQPSFAIGQRALLLQTGTCSLPLGVVPILLASHPAKMRLQDCLRCTAMRCPTCSHVLCSWRQHPLGLCQHAHR